MVVVSQRHANAIVSAIVPGMTARGRTYRAPVNLRHPEQLCYNIGHVRSVAAN